MVRKAFYREESEESEDDNQRSEKANSDSDSNDRHDDDDLENGNGDDDDDDDDDDDFLVNKRSPLKKRKMSPKDKPKRGRPKKETPKKATPAKPAASKTVTPKKKVSKNPRNKISPSKTPASKRKFQTASTPTNTPRSGGRAKKRISYGYDEVDSDEFEQSESESESMDDSDSEEDVAPRGRGRPPMGYQKGKSPQKSPAKSSHPPLKEMIIDCIKALKDNPKKGSTLGSIKETISMNWTLNMKTYDGRIKKTLMKAIDAGEIIRVKGTGFRGRFTVPGMKVKRKKRRNKLPKDDVDEDEKEYTAPITERDEDRARHLEELEELRLKRQLEEERKAAEKALKPKRKIQKKENYEVEAIKGIRERNGETLYLVKFEGWKKPQWEPEENVEGCQDLIDQFEREEEKKRLEDEARERAQQEDGHFEVQRIIDVRFLKKNDKREFLIRWKGCGPSDDTWEPEEHLDDEEMIEKFMKKWEKESLVEEKRLREAPKKVARLAFAATGSRIGRRNNGFRTTYEGMDD
ncbi:eukaryotic translation initiation factor 5B-like [Tigriopus californicus]|uniref:eukaryotic translation initiation factor 5B-like n=1 Tax=Tigriopus californicus TaxID=6832 RepID=UPI0027DA84B7|nr:eukaryotic translation initiation factor 5B-like [Tigriopus californicus]